MAEAIDHVDLVVSDLDRSLAFYRGLLGHLGYIGEGEIVGERGERVVYLHRHGGEGAIGLRERVGGEGG
jgi:glyoxylase I family protein